VIELDRPASQRGFIAIVRNASGKVIADVAFRIPAAILNGKGNFREACDECYAEAKRFIAQYGCA
jgi:hypothetical protein